MGCFFNLNLKFFLLKKQVFSTYINLSHWIGWWHKGIVCVADRIGEKPLCYPTTQQWDVFIHVSL